MGLMELISLFYQSPTILPFRPRLSCSRQCSWVWGQHYCYFYTPTLYSSAYCRRIYWKVVLLRWSFEPSSTWETSFTQSASMIYSHLSTTNQLSTFKPGIPTTIDELSSYDPPRESASLSRGKVKKDLLALTTLSMHFVTSPDPLLISKRDITIVV